MKNARIKKIVQQVRRIQNHADDEGSVLQFAADVLRELEEEVEDNMKIKKCIEDAEDAALFKEAWDDQQIPEDTSHCTLIQVNKRKGSY